MQDSQTEPTDLYSRLAAPFTMHFVDTRGGVEFEYLIGEQIVSRLNEVLGPGRWSFLVSRQGEHHEADEVWVHGRLEAIIDGQTVIREQFGSQKIRRSTRTKVKVDGAEQFQIQEIGSDYKAAATDAFKKCAEGLGVGLYLKYRVPDERGRPVRIRHMPSGGPSRPQPTEAPDGLDPSTGETLTCAKCGGPIRRHEFANGDTWVPVYIAQQSQSRFGERLCFNDYKAAKDARDQAAGTRSAERRQRRAAAAGA